MGLRVMLVLVLVVGAVVVEELGECVGLRVQMKVEVALVARRRSISPMRESFLIFLNLVLFNREIFVVLLVTMGRRECN